MLISQLTFNDKRTGITIKKTNFTTTKTCLYDNNLKQISDFVGNCVQQIEANLGKCPIYEQTMWLSCHGFWFVSACKFTDSCNLVYFFTPRSACRLHLDQKWFLCAQFKFCSNMSCLQMRPAS